MSDREAMAMARDLVRGSIIEDAASRFISQVLKEAHDSRIKPLRDRIEALEADKDAMQSALTLEFMKVDALEAKVELLREALVSARRVLEWGEPEPKPILKRVEAALAKTSTPPRDGVE